MLGKHLAMNFEADFDLILLEKIRQILLLFLMLLKRLKLAELSFKAAASLH